MDMDQPHSANVFHLSAVLPGHLAALPRSLRSARDYIEAGDHLRALAAAYPGHTIRVITTLKPCDDDRMALRMIASGLGIELDLI